jgi:formate dehydrogenase iron-sulfur subunit
MSMTLPPKAPSGGRDPAALSGWADHPDRVGFFTDTSVCIGCKACEVACKEWNNVPDDGLKWLGQSYDHTGELGANTWRHVQFIEQRRRPGTAEEGLDAPLLEHLPLAQQEREQGFRWLMSSDVCKHCTSAACLDVCPTGALFRTEFGTVVVQQDVCNGCGYCVPACPFGVIDRREEDGRVWKCTLCYDRLKGGFEPACAQACPTDSIQFGPLDELKTRAKRRVRQLHDEGFTDARLYGADPDDGVGGLGAFFLLFDEPEAYRLPPDPVVPTRDLPAMWNAAAKAAAAMTAAAVLAFVGARR